jgi:sarcosine oxidase subunit alpha
VDAVGSVTGEGLPKVAPEPTYPGKGKCFVCVCEDVTTKDLKRAIGEGFDSIELAKRYTTATMGPCQGKLCHLSSIRIYAQGNRMYESAIGTTTARPPWAPVELGLLAGRDRTPARRGSIHWRHEEAGATIQWAGPWKRPYAYGEKPEDEVRAVHDSLGVIDVSTLGKLIVEGPEAVALLERLYPNRFGDLQPGRIRYGVLTSDGGRIMDDGTIARLADDRFYITTTSTGADAVTAWFEWWNAVWGYDVEIVNVTGALAAVNLAGPRAREALGELTDADVSNEALKYLDAKEITVAGVPCLALRIGFVGELGYELHCAASAGEHIWDALVGRGAVPFGLEPQRVLRLEKAHIIVGQDTDSESNALEAGMPWIVKFEKDDFVGKWALEHARDNGDRERLVGFEMASWTVPPEGGQIVRDGRAAGRVTSARWSQTLGKSIGLAWLPPELAEEDAEFTIRVDGRLEPARVRLRPFFDPEGERLRA